jgi:hypothetical protein
MTTEGKWALLGLSNAPFSADMFGLRPFIVNLCSVAFLTSPRDVVVRADTKGVIYERAGDCFCRRVGF